MRAHAAVFTLSLSLSFTPVSAQAQEALQVVDSADVVLGPVVGVVPSPGAGRPQFLFAYAQDGEAAILRVEHAGRITQVNGETAGTIVFYYPTANCSGSPAMTTHGDCCLPPMLPTIIPDALGQLWVADVTQTINPVVASRRAKGNSDVHGPCEPISPAATQGFALSLWGTLDFTPPVRIERNPFIFGDDFSSADSSAWSNNR